ncbi:MAG: antibiotic biosynthesis monooxygenase [Bacilli bacterium]|nr:antibiotic biosynthesis monooxygenase [Bacilli bacterium]
MSIVVNIYYKGINGNAIKFMQEMEEKGIADLIRKEEGNERYEYFISASDKETVLLIDIWKDQKSIDIHHSTPMMKQISELREKYDLHMTVERFIQDDTGIPEYDKSFIKK